MRHAQSPQAGIAGKQRGVWCRLQSLQCQSGGHNSEIEDTGFSEQVKVAKRGQSRMALSIPAKATGCVVMKVPKPWEEEWA